MTTAAKTAEVVKEAFRDPTTEDTVEEVAQWRTPGFQRMRVDWRSRDRHVIYSAKDAVNDRLVKEFADAYRLIVQIYEIVRIQDVDTTTGELRTDASGRPIWKRNSLGGIEEDFTKLTYREKENLLFAITTHLFEWQQLAADAWGEAMFAKGQWEERFSIGQDAVMSGTDQIRETAGKLDARDERYFAILMAMYSRKADALVRSLELISQRIKDSMTS